MEKEAPLFKNQNWSATFINALNGCFYSLKTQRNFKIHLVISFLVIGLSLWLKISKIEFLIIVFAIVFGLVMEMANTAFEKTVDLITEEYHSKAKIAKDVSAGMMLVASIGLAILGFLILLPPLVRKFF